MMNPAMLFQMKGLWERFERNHPKFPKFLQAAGRECLEDGTVIEITITKPDGEKIASNLKLNAEDMELIQALEKISRS